MIKTLRRLGDRRRYLNSRHGWLFRPYTGDELMAISARQRLEQQTLEVAVWRLSGSQLEADQTALHLQLPWLFGQEAERSAGCPVSCGERLQTLDAALERLLECLGNRPLLGWRLEQICQPLNRQLRGRLGFDLPSAGIDVAQLYQRRRRLPESVTLDEAAAGMSIAVESGVVGAAYATAQLYRRLQQPCTGDRSG
ncbi:MAG TPA: 3'-5' exonuclease [Halomonas sp.]|nr:3'-5' exonuclease [Halomonas sp.]